MVDPQWNKVTRDSAGPTFVVVPATMLCLVTVQAMKRQLPGIARLKLQPASMVLEALQAYNKPACNKPNRSNYHVQNPSMLHKWCHPKSKAIQRAIPKRVDRAPDLTGPVQSDGATVQGLHRPE